MEFLGTVMEWVKWLGVGGVVAAVVLMIFAPSVLRVLAEFLLPIAKATGEFIVWFFRDILWVGFKDMTDNLASVVFVVTCILLGGWYLSKPHDCKPSCDKAIAELRKDYKFVKRTPTEKRAYRKQTQPSSEWWRWW